MHSFLFLLLPPPSPIFSSSLSSSHHQPAGSNHPVRTEHPRAGVPEAHKLCTGVARAPRAQKALVWLLPPGVVLLPHRPLAGSASFVSSRMPARWAGEVVESGRWAAEPGGSRGEPRLAEAERDPEGRRSYGRRTGSGTALGIPCMADMLAVRAEPAPAAAWPTAAGSSERDHLWDWWRRTHRASIPMKNTSLPSSVDASPPASRRQKSRAPAGSRRCSAARALAIRLAAPASTAGTGSRGEVERSGSGPAVSRQMGRAVLGLWVDTEIELAAGPLEKALRHRRRRKELGCQHQRRGRGQAVGD